MAINRFLALLALCALVGMMILVVKDQKKSLPQSLRRLSASNYVVQQTGYDPRTVETKQPYYNAQPYGMPQQPYQPLTTQQQVFPQQPQYAQQQQQQQPFGPYQAIQPQYQQAEPANQQQYGVPQQLYQPLTTQQQVIPQQPQYAQQQQQQQPFGPYQAIQPQYQQAEPANQQQHSQASDQTLFAPQQVIYQPQAPVVASNFAVLSPTYSEHASPYPTNGEPEMPGTQAAYEVPSDTQLIFASKKNILTLGGSTTWGSKLDDRESAYPFLLEEKLGDKWNVYNLAVRATDASYAAQCIESMIRDGVDIVAPELHVILLEYSLNGLDGMPLLLKRLRRKFPSATILYVHLWSLRMTVDNANTGAKPREELNKGMKFVEADKSMNAMLNDPDAKWKWAPKMYQDSIDISEEAAKAIGPVGGHLLQLPMPDSPQKAFDEHWFGPDFHHLSEAGHELMANEIVQKLKDPSILSSPRVDAVTQQWNDGSWGNGDNCYSWYETGDHPDVRIEGGTMKMFVKPNKYGLHVGLTFGQPAKIYFPNQKTAAVPIMLMLMSWGEGVYPKSNIDVESPGFEMQSMLLDPLHTNPLNHLFHVTRTAHIGWANPGEAVVTVDPIEDKQRPLRIVGIVLCAACMEMDVTYLNNDASHQRLRTEVISALSGTSGN